MSVRAIREVKAEPSAAIVQLLEGILDRARRGEVLGISVAAHLTGNETMQAWALGNDGDVAHLICALERAKLRLLGGDDTP